MLLSRKDSLTVGYFFFEEEEEEEEGAELSATTVSLGATLVLHQLWNELLILTCLASVV